MDCPDIVDPTQALMASMASFVASETPFFALSEIELSLDCYLSASLPVNPLTLSLLRVVNDPHKKRFSW